MMDPPAPLVSALVHIRSALFMARELEAGFQQLASQLAAANDDLVAHITTYE